MQRWGLAGVHPQPGSPGQEEAGGGGGQWGSVNRGRAAWTEVPVGTCRLMNAGYQWDQEQQWGGQEVALPGYKRARRYAGREMGTGSQELEGQEATRKDAQPGRGLTLSGGH